MGGGGIYGTTPDYAKYVEMMLNDGVGTNGNRVLEAATVELMSQNHIGELGAGVLHSVLHELSYPLVDFFPGTEQKWGLSFLINMEDSPHGRSAGSLTWAGLANTYFWIDRRKKLGGVLMTQILPFGDPKVLELYNGFERAIYGQESQALAPQAKINTEAPSLRPGLDLAPPSTDRVTRGAPWCWGYSRDSLQIGRAHV